MNIYEKLAAVQQELKAPKDKYNKFGGFAYRSAEGILEAVKPILAKYKTTITITDTIEQINGRFYVKATVQFVDCEQIPETSWNADGITVKKAFLEVTAYAREADEKKGLDVSQVTGTASSYARKYALNGLLLIDDTKDADTDEYAKVTSDQNTREKAPKTPENQSDGNQRATAAQIKTIGIMAEKAGLTISAITKKPLEEFTVDEATQLLRALREKAGE